MRCTDHKCAEVRLAKRRGLGEKVIHVYDLVTQTEWTEYELPGEPGEKE